MGKKKGKNKNQTKKTTNNNKPKEIEVIKEENTNIENNIQVETKKDIKSKVNSKNTKNKNSEVDTKKVHNANEENRTNSKKENKQEKKKADNKENDKTAQVIKKEKDKVEIKDTEKKENNQEKKNKKQENKKEQNLKEEKNDNKKEKSNNLNKAEEKTASEEKDFEQVEYKPKKKKKKLKIFLIFIIIILLALLGIATIPSLIVRTNEKMANGLLINNIPVEKISYEEAKEKLTEKANKIVESDLKIVMGEYENTIDLSQISANYDIDKAVQEAHNIGRTSNIFKSSYDVLISNYSGKNIELDVTFNEEEVNSLFNNISQEIPGHVVGWSYSIDNSTNKLTITKGTKGIRIDEEETTKRIKEAMLSSLKGEKVDTIELATVEAEPDPIDVDKIHEEVYREPQDAYVTQDPFGVYVHVDGIDFNVDEVKALVASEDKEYTIELTITEPEITTKELGEEAFPDIIGKTYKTTYSAGDRNRNTNIELAAKHVNGIILMPGETFSYNGILGDTTADKGYKPAGAYLNGEVVQSYGGGICQVSSTIYNAVLYANLEITERYNHSFLSGYVPAGLDATVSYGTKDFKFTNNRDYPIKLVVTAGNGTISATVYGVKQDDDVKVELQSVITSYISPKVKYEKTDTLEEGKEKVKQAGSSGCKCTVYITKTRDGQQISREVLNNDVYSAKPKIILQGTKKVEKSE